MRYSIPLLQAFLKIVSKPAYLHSLEFLLNMTETNATNVTFKFHVVRSRGFDFVCTLFLTFEFSVIFEVLIFENGCTLVWGFPHLKECGPKVPRIQENNASPGPISLHLSAPASFAKENLGSSSPGLPIVARGTVTKYKRN